MKKNILFFIAFFAILSSPIRANFLTTLKKYYAPPAIITGMGFGAWELYNYFAKKANPSWKTYVAATALGTGIFTYLIAPKISKFDVIAQTMENGRTKVTVTTHNSKKFANYDENGKYMPYNSTMKHEEAQDALKKGKTLVNKALLPYNSSKPAITAQ